MSATPLLRVVVVEPRPPTWRDRAKQVAWAMVRVVQGDPKPTLYAVNPAGWGKRLFVASTCDEAYAKRDRLERELGILGMKEWCERYSVPLSFVEALNPPDDVRRGLRRFDPLL